MTEQKCATCRYWQVAEGGPEGPSRGTCRVRAPVEQMTQELWQNARWPLTRTKDWCGDWESREPLKIEPGQITFIPPDEAQQWRQMAHKLADMVAALGGKKP